MHTIRWGIIGCGSMGREHILNLAALGGAEVTAIADPDANSRAQAEAVARGARFAPAMFEQHHDLLASGRCDAVIVASPNFTHAAVLRDVLATDLHLLTEKPLVTRMEDGLALLQQAAGRKALTWVAQEYRYMPPVAEAIRMAHGGEVGRIHQVAIREHREPFYPKVGDWNRFSANTGGTLVEKCCHYFNLMDLIVGEPAARVFASGGQSVNHLDESYAGPDGPRTPDILDNAYVIVEYPGGARACLDLCMFAEGSTDNEHLVIVGDEGKLESLLPSLTLRHSRREDWGRRAVWGEKSGSGRGVSVRRVWDTSIRYAGAHFGASFIEHQHFAAALREGRPAEIGLEEGLRSVATGIAAQRSIAERRMVDISEVWPS